MGELSESNSSQSESVDSLVGKTFDAHYLVEKCIGEGGASTVFKCRDLYLNRTVVIKLLKQELIDVEGKLERFQREGQALCKLRHDNIIGLLSIGIAPGWQPYLVMPHFEGRTLAELIEQDISIELPRVLEIFIQISQALSFAHREGIVHRDLKPGNVFVPAEMHETVKVIDFGIAKLLSGFAPNSQKITGTGDVFGTCAYMSPEQWRSEPIDARSDIYSMGCLMYETLTKQVPYQIDDLVAVMLENDQDMRPRALTDGSIPLELAGVIEKCMSFDCSKRYQSADELTNDLLQIKAHAEAGASESTRAKAIATVTARSLRLNSNRSVPIAIGVSLLLACISAYALGDLYAIQYRFLSWVESLGNSSGKERLLLAGELAKRGSIRPAAVEMERLLGAVALNPSLLSNSELADLYAKLTSYYGTLKESKLQQEYSLKAIHEFENLAQKAEQKKDYAGAAAYLKNALLCWEIGGESNLADEGSKILIRLAQFQDLQGQLERDNDLRQKADHNYLKAILLLEKNERKQRAELAKLYYLHGNILQECRFNFLEAFTAYKKAYRFFVMTVPKADPIFELLFAKLENLAQEKEAESLLIRRFIYEARLDSLGARELRTLDALISYASELEQAGRHMESGKLLQAALNDANAIGARSKEAIILISLASSKQALNDVSSARSCYSRAIEICRELGVPMKNHLSIAEASYQALVGSKR